MIAVDENPYENNLIKHLDSMKLKYQKLKHGLYGGPKTLTQYTAVLSVPYQVRRACHWGAATGGLPLGGCMRHAAPPGRGGTRWLCLHVLADCACTCSCCHA